MYVRPSGLRFYYKFFARFCELNAVALWGYYDRERVKD